MTDAIAGDGSLEFTPEEQERFDRNLGLVDGSRPVSDPNIEEDLGIPFTIEEQANFEQWGTPQPGDGPKIREVNQTQVVDLQEVPVPAKTQWKDEAIGHLWMDAQNRNLSEEEEVLRISRIMQTPSPVVRKNLGEYRKIIENSKWGIADMRLLQPDLYRIMGTNPELAHGIKTAVKEDMSTLKRALRLSSANVKVRNREAKSLGFDGVDDTSLLAGYSTSGNMSVFAKAMFPERFEVDPVEPFSPGEIRALQKEAVTPQDITAFKSPLLAEQDGISKSLRIIGARIDETERQHDAANARANMALAILSGADEDTLLDLENEARFRSELSATATHYGDQGSLGSLSDAIGGAQSTIGGFKKGGAVAAVVLGATTLAGAAVGQPVKGLKFGATLLPYAMGYGIGSHSFQQELGGYLLGTDNLKSDDGRSIPKDVQLATGLTYAAMASATEIANEMTLGIGAFGTLGAIVRSGNIKLFSKAAKKVPELAAIVAGVRKIAKRAAGEGLEEGTQQLQNDVNEYTAKSLTDGRMNNADVRKSLEGIAESGRVGFLTGALVAGASMTAGRTVDAVVRKFTRQEQSVVYAEAKREYKKIEDSALGAERLAAIIETSKGETGQASPATLAKIIEQNSQHDPVTAIYFDPAAVIAEFETRGLDANLAVSALGDATSSKRLDDAVVTGNKFRVPMEEWIGFWQKDGLSEALREDMVDKPHLYTIREASAVSDSVQRKAESIESEFNQETFGEVTQEDGAEAEARAQEAGQEFEQSAKEASEDIPAISENIEDAFSIHRAFMHVMAERVGSDPLELFADTPLKVSKIGDIKTTPEEQVGQDGTKRTRTPKAPVQDTVSGRRPVDVQGANTSGEGRDVDGGGVFESSTSREDAPTSNGKVVARKPSVEDLAIDEASSVDAIVDAVVKKAFKIPPSPPAKHLERIPSKRSAFEDIVDSVGGTDASPSEQADGKYRAWENAVAARKASNAKRAKPPKGVKRASVPLGVERPGPFPGGTFDAVNEHLRSSEDTPTFRAVSGAYEAFVRMTKGGLRWDSVEMNTALEILAAVPGMENIHLPDEIEASIEEVSLNKELAEPFGDAESIFKQDVSDNIRGLIQVLRRGTAVSLEIFLNKSADTTTLLHEMAHGYLEMIHNISKGFTPSGVQGEIFVTDQANKDFHDILDYLGADNFSSLTVKQNELWAKSFEKYIFEGRSPSRSLAAVFQRLRLLVLETYKIITGLEHIELNDNIRGIFDRMLATDKEIAYARRRIGIPGSAHDSVGTMAASQAAADIFAQREKAVSEVAAKKLALAENLAAKEYGEIPAVKASRYLRDNPDAKAEMDIVAGMFNFPSATTLQDALANIQDRSGFVEARGLEIAKDANPEIFNEQAVLQKSVEESMHHASKVESLVSQWRVLVRKSKAKGIPNTDAIARAAHSIVGRMGARRLNLSKASAHERAMAEASTLAAASGNFAKAAELKGKQILAHFLWKEIQNARQLRDSFQKSAAQFSRNSSRQRLGKADPAYRDVMDSLLEAVGISARVTPEVHGERATPADLERVMAGHGHSALFDNAELSKLIYGPGKHWKDMTVAELSGIFFAINNISQGASSQNRVLVNGRLIDKATFKVRAIAEIESNLPDLGPVDDNGRVQMLKAGLIWASRMDASMLKPQTIVDWMGGEDINSTWHQMIWRPLQDASNLEEDLKQKFLTPVFDLMNAMPDSSRKRWSEDFDGRAAFPDHVEDLVPRSRFEILIMALHRGSTSSVRRLTEGRKITISQVDAAIATLTSEELAWVQSIWDAFAGIWPMTQKVYEQDTGVKPDAMTPAPFTVTAADGKKVEMRGGYFPAIYDGRVSHLGAEQQARLEEEMMVVGRPSVNQDHLKHRSFRKDDVLSFEPRTIQAGLARAIHYVAFRQPVKSVQNLIFDEDVFAAMRRRIGGARADVIKQWVRDLGGSGLGINAVDTHMPKVEAFMRRRKSAFTTAILGHAVRVAIPDVTNLPMAALSTDLQWRYAAAGLTNSLADPVASRKFALGNSGLIRRMKNDLAREFEREANRMAQDVSVPKKVLNFYIDHGFAAMQLINNGVATTVWNGAYQQASDGNKTHDQAVEFADQVVSQAMPSHSIVDKPALLRGKGFLSAITVFWGYFATLYNQERRNWHNVHIAEGGIEKSKAAMSALTTHFATLLITHHIAALIMGKGPEEDEEWKDWFIRGIAGGSLDPLPFGVAYNVEQLFFERRSTSRPVPAAAFIDEFTRLFIKISKDEVDPKETAMQALRATGILFGIPIDPLRGAKYLSDLMDGGSGIRAENAGDVIGGLLYGEREKPIFNLFSGDNSR